jgi:hypothetical protein
MQQATTAHMVPTRPRHPREIRKIPCQGWWGVRGPTEAWARLSLHPTRVHDVVFCNPPPPAFTTVFPSSQPPSCSNRLLGCPLTLCIMSCAKQPCLRHPPPLTLAAGSSPPASLFTPPHTHTPTTKGCDCADPQALIAVELNELTAPAANGPPPVLDHLL